MGGDYLLVAMFISSVFFVWALLLTIKLINPAIEILPAAEVKRLRKDAGMEASRLEAKDQEIEELRVRLRGGAERELEKTKAELRAKVTHVEELGKQIERLRSEKEETESKSLEVSADIENEVERLKEELENSQTELNNAKETSDRLKIEKEEIESKATEVSANVEGEVERLKVDLENRQKELDRIKSETDRLRSEKGELDALGDTKREELEKRVSELTLNLSKKDEEIRKKVDEIDAFKRRLDESINEREHDDNRQEVISEKESELETLRDEIQKLNQAIKTEGERRDAEDEENKTLVKDLDVMRGEKCRLEGQFQGKEQELINKQAETDLLNVEVATLKAELENVKGKLGAKINNINVLNEQIVALKETTSGGSEDDQNVEQFSEEVEAIEKTSGEQYNYSLVLKQRIDEATRKIAILNEKAKEGVMKIAQFTGTPEFTQFREELHVEDMKMKYEEEISRLKNNIEELRGRLTHGNAG